MIKEILIIIIVVLAGLIAWSIIKKLLKIAFTLAIVAVLIIVAVSFLAKTDYNDLSENFNEMNTLIVIEKNGEYTSALEKMQLVEEITSIDSTFEKYELVVIINKEIDLVSEFSGTSKENIKKIAKLKKEDKATVIPETMYFRMSGFIPIR